MGLMDLFKKKKKPFVSAVIAAGGSSTRMGGENKLLAELDGIPVLARTLMAFQANENVDEIVLVARDDLLVTYANLARAYDIVKTRQVVAGGATRAESVWKGVTACDPKSDIVLVHDGARPLVPQSVIDRVIEGVQSSTCAAAAVPVTDTIRRFDKDKGFYQLVPREELRAMQTPQGADRKLLAAALQHCVENKLEVTDDVAALTELGANPALVDGSYRNIKITTKEDLAIAASLLEVEG